MSLLESEERLRQRTRRAPSVEPPLAEAVDEAIEAARQRLFELQAADGHWCGELEGDSILESEYLLALVFLGRSAGDRRVRGLANTLRRTQLADGSWAAYPGGAADLSATVKAYFALKLAGDAPEAPHMERARATARHLGGLEACNSFTRIYLAVFGQVEWEACPAVPPEVVLLPTWFPFNLYAMSAWSRTIVVPLSLIWALRPSCAVPDSARLDELRLGRAGRRPQGGLWARFFSGLDRALRLAERWRIRPLRRRALAQAEAWIRQRLQAGDGLGAIFPPIVNTIFAFRALGYSADDPVVTDQLYQLERLELADGDALWVQPCFSAVWDTALAASALAESGEADDPRLRCAARWLREREVRRSGDWRVNCPGTEASGWCFQYKNEFYPDCDDTAQVVTSLAKVDLSPEEPDAQLARAQRWLLGMQSTNGGWGSFDKDCEHEFLTQVPFADHNAMIDPPTVDVTARVLEALVAAGMDPASPPVRRAVDFVLGEQEPDGSWYGRWGCNYLYGTWLALVGLERAGEDTRGSAWGVRARRWLERCQNDDGGWGELPASYADPRLKGQGPSTASQTAWAVLGLLVAGERSGAVERGLRHLLAGQRADGGWQDGFWTGTGFPEVFYLRYHLYATYFPLLALARWRQDQEAAGSSSPKLSA